MDDGMFEAEAIWLGNLLNLQAGENLSPLLNIGSSTRQFREIEQPWTERFIFAPLKQRGVDVLHLDSRTGEGIDIQADVLSAAELPRIRSLGPKAVLCCNILEHVTDPAALASRCAEIVGPGGLIFVTVPYSYPHHRDPIDTMFRPAPDELARMFSPAVMLRGEIIDTGESWWNDVARRPWILLRPLLRLPFPFVNFPGWKRSVRRLYWLQHRYRVTGALFRVPSGAKAIIDMEKCES
jgi:SAM-dependent methyltransferase